MSASTSRRAFARSIAALAAAAALPAGLLGCATRGPAPRVVVIGGGFAGATAAKYLRLWGAGRVDVTLVERNARFVSCPLSNLVLAGTRSLDALTFGYDGLAAHGVRVVRDDATALDANARRVTLASGRVLDYDRAIVAPGIDLLYASIAGFESPEAQRALPAAWKAGPETLALRAQLEAMPIDGRFVIAIPRAPYRCPPGPYERVCQVAHYLKAAKPRARIVVLDANPEPISKKALFEAAWRDLYPGLVEYRGNHEVREVDWRGRTARTDFETFRGDVLNVIPPMRAGEIARRAGLVTANDRWCGVNWQTMESSAMPGVHVLGDATLAAAAMPKSASMANNHAKIAASAIVAAFAGETPNPRPTINNTCYSYVSDREAIHVDSVHAWDAAGRTLAPVAGSGGVSSARSALEHDYADAWARNIWVDSLA
jgi:sulfide dehydrogenase [flavocytochrome c] flavoprotein chain